MKKIFSSLVLISISNMYATDNIEITTGWQLVGSSYEVKDVSKVFNKSSIKVIWIFDKDTMKWKGYSPNSQIMQLLQNHNIEIFSYMPKNSGFWVFGQNPDNIVIGNSTSVDDNDSSNENTNNDDNTTQNNNSGLTITQTDNSQWDGGFCKNVYVHNNTNHDIDWEVSFKVDGKVYNHWNANLQQDSQTLIVTASGVDWNNIVQPHSKVEFGYCAYTNSNGGNDNNNNNNNGNDNDTNIDINSSNNQDINITYTPAYSKVLPLALKFYEAQRASGPFPTVTWRKPAALTDGQDVGRDLSGGWFDAGDHVKFNLPMSYSTTVLNWGMLEFPKAYQKTNQTQYGKDQVKYALDYFLQAYDEGSNPDSASDDKVYYQVGDPHADHAFWGPPEKMTMKRPTYTCDATHKCSEVAAGMAAALASGSILFSDNSDYSQTLLDKAKKIYRFAEEYQGNNGYKAASGFYTSFSGYNDELAWGAIWLYKATKDKDYLEKAKTYVTKSQDALSWAHSWDNVSNGTYLLLAKITGDSKYKSKIVRHLNNWIKGVNGIKYTSGGLAFLNQWGSLRYSSTTAFIALVYAKDLNNSDEKNSLISFAKGQIDYILGDNPRHSSYVVGFGNNPPKNPHHRAAHNSPTNNIDNPVNNEFVLEGALVGGPKSADDFNYKDDRRDYICNEVATDYNAGFTGAIAGLISLTKEKN